MSGGTTPATLRCSKCGAEFACDPAGDCWCKDETFRVPLPKSAAESCLCPSCLRAVALTPTPPSPVKGEGVIERDPSESPPPLRGRVREGGSR